MTCDDFRTRNKDFDTLAGLSRGERASCAAHWRDCQACRSWLIVHEAVHPEDPGRLGESKDLARTDKKNPEFREIVFGE